MLRSSRLRQALVLGLWVSQSASTGSAQETESFVGRVNTVAVVGSTVPHVRVSFHEVEYEVPGSGNLDLVYRFYFPITHVGPGIWLPELRSARRVSGRRPGALFDEVSSGSHSLIDACAGEAYVRINKHSPAAPGILSTVLTALTSDAVVQPRYVKRGDECELISVDLMPPPPPPQFSPSFQVPDPEIISDRCDWARAFDFAGAGANCTPPSTGSDAGSGGTGGGSTSCVVGGPCSTTITVPSCAAGTKTATVRGEIVQCPENTCEPVESYRASVCTSCGPGCGQCAGNPCDSAADCAPGATCQSQTAGPMICVNNPSCPSFGLTGCWTPGANGATLPCLPL
jgi:hypothetical protein